MLRIAVAGCGRLARHVHLPVLARLPGVEVVAVIDPVASCRKSALDICPRAEPFAQLHEVWDRSRVDAVVISAPTALHPELAIAALRQGAHIYLEKPLAGSLRDAERILAAWDQRGQTAMIGFNYRFHRLFESARRAIADRVVGTPFMVSTVFASSNTARNDWRAQAGGGGALLDLGSHHVDLIHFLFGERVTAVFAQTSAVHAEQCTATMQLKLESGILVTCGFSFGTVDQDRIEIFGDRAMLRVDRYLSTDCEIIPVTGQRLRMRQMGAAISFIKRPGEILAKFRAPGNELSYRTALLKFVEAARTNTPVTPDLHDGYRAAAVIAAAEQSMDRSCWVAVAS